MAFWIYEPCFSVILPTYNRAGWISQAINSVLHQSYVDWELVIVDDGSSDGSSEILSRYAAADFRIRVWSQDNQGVATARNRAIFESRGRYAVFLDSDDQLLPTALEQLAAAVTENPALKLLYGDWLFSESDVMHRVLAPSIPPDTERPIHFLIQNPIATSGTLVDMAVLKARGGFRPCMVVAEDLDLWISLALQYPIYKVEEPLAIRRSHAGQLSQQGRQVRYYVDSICTDLFYTARDSLGFAAELDDLIRRLLAGKRPIYSTLLSIASEAQLLTPDPAREVLIRRLEDGIQAAAAAGNLAPVNSEYAQQVKARREYGYVPVPPV